MNRRNFTGSSNHPTCRGEDSQALSRKRMSLRVLFFVGIGAMILTVFCLLPGCGSDSKPGSSVAGKEEKSSKSTKPGKSQGVMPLVLEEKTKSGNLGQAPKASSQRIEVLPGMTQAELEAKAAESLVEMKKAAKTRGPIVGGMTQEQLEAKYAESQKMLHSKGGGEIFPGITQKELEEMASKGHVRQSTSVEILPGATQKQVDAAASSRAPEFREIFPSSVGK
jgi:hypothetical protein